MWRCFFIRATFCMCIFYYIICVCVFIDRICMYSSRPCCPILSDRLIGTKKWRKTKNKSTRSLAQLRQSNRIRTVIGSPKLYWLIARRMHQDVGWRKRKMKTLKSNHCYVLFLRWYKTLLWSLPPRCATTAFYITKEIIIGNNDSISEFPSFFCIERHLCRVAGDARWSLFW